MGSYETIGTVKSSSRSSLPTLPFDLTPEILSRLPVKFLLQFRCLCKSWKYLISDPKFAKKHLTLSTTHTFHCTSYSHNNVHILLKSYSPDAVLTNITQTQFPSPDHRHVSFIGSCNGILCLVLQGIVGLVLIQLWNPSIRKFKELPSISPPRHYRAWIYGFGYDPISDNYKVVVVLCNYNRHDYFSEHEVKVHTLGTNSCRSVSEFPFAIVSLEQLGKYVSGTINWLIFTGIKWFIASFDLGNECYQEVLLPGEVDEKTLNLHVFKDCLCMISGGEVWVMKEYGNKESWTNTKI